MNNTLYEIVGQYKGLMLIADDLPEDALADTLEAITDDLQTKGRNITQVIKNFDTTGIDVEIKRLQAMKKTINNRKESLKSYLRMNMVAGDISKIEWPTGSVTLRKPLDVVNVTDVSLLPKTLVKTTVSANKVAIKAALKAGDDVPGAELGKGLAGILIK